MTDGATTGGLVGMACRAGLVGWEMLTTSILITAPASLIDYVLLRICPFIGPERRGWQTNAVGEIA